MATFARVDDAAYWVRGTVRMSDAAWVQSSLRFNRETPERSKGLRIVTGRVIEVRESPPPVRVQFIYRDGRSRRAWLNLGSRTMIGKSGQRCINDLLILPPDDEIPEVVRDVTHEHRLLVVRLPRADVRAYGFRCGYCLGEIFHEDTCTEAASIRYYHGRLQLSKVEITDGDSCWRCDHCARPFHVSADCEPWC